MKRAIGALLLTLGLVVPPMQVANAAPDDSVKGKACGDITVEAPGYTNQGGLAAGVGQVDTAKPSCVGVSYVLRVYSTGGQLLGTAQVEGDGVTGVGTSLQLYAPLTDQTSAPSSVCLSFSSESGTKVIDQAPNTPDNGCAVGALFLLNGGSGARSMK